MVKSMMLSKEQEVRANKLHNESIIIIAHDHCYRRSDFDGMRKGGVTAKVVKLTADNIVWMEKGKSHIPAQDEWPEVLSAMPRGNFQTRYYFNNSGGWRALYEDALNGVFQIAEDEDSDVMIIRSVSDIYNAKKNGKVGVIIGNEGSRFLEGDITMVEEFYSRGMREIQLFWPGGNQLFTGSHMSKFGKEVIKECNRLGILVDLSHINQVSDQVFWEAIETSKDPLIISHDAPKALGGEELNDEQIRGIAQSGDGRGVLALHFMTTYAGRTPSYIKNQSQQNAPATVEDLVIAIDYVVQLVGIDHVALGADWLSEQGHIWTVDINRMFELTRALVKKGYPDKDIKKILGGSMIRLFEKVWRD